MKSLFFVCLLAIGFPMCGQTQPPTAPDGKTQEASSVASPQPQFVPAKTPGAIRIATYNVSLNRPQAGVLTQDLSDGHPQIAAVAAVIRTVQPDILLLNEVDYLEDADHGRMFNDLFLGIDKTDRLGNGPWPMDNAFSAAVNTGVLSGLDINQDGKIVLPDDGWGFGRFPGQYGMVVLSRFAIDVNSVQTLQNTLWLELPEPLVPKDPTSDTAFYDAKTWSQLRLASKSFWDVPIETPLGSLHVLASHPTPPAFDGSEDRNGCRNHDEIRLIEHYVDGTLTSLSDQDRKAALPAQASFVVLGDLNSDPEDGGSRGEAIRRLLSHPRIAGRDAPQSRGAAAASQTQGKINLKHAGPASEDTADFNDRSVGNLRVDYVLPSSDFQIVASGVFWPSLDDIDEQYRDAVNDALEASDHHLVWVDVTKNLGDTSNQK